jgi:hypothetical protein
MLLDSILVSINDLMIIAKTYFFMIEYNHHNILHIFCYLFKPKLMLKIMYSRWILNYFMYNLVFSKCDLNYK